MPTSEQDGAIQRSQGDEGSWRQEGIQEVLECVFCVEICTSKYLVKLTLMFVFHGVYAGGGAFSTLPIACIPTLRIYTPCKFDLCPKCIL